MAAKKKHVPARTAGAAQKADKYDLYLKSVQAPDVDVVFFDRVYRTEYKQPAAVLREDFCGTAAVCYEWVKRHPKRRAIGVDNDPEPLNWGVKHLRPKISEADAERVRLLEDDVRAIKGEKADVIAAQNFSFQCFKTRDELRKYFEAARKNLAKKGVLILDAMGGPEVIEEDRREKTKFRNFTYIWDQARFDPITHDCKFHIHFRFKDGSRWRNAFTYEWRLWTLPELQELLIEAGFKRADVYWEGTDADSGDGNGIYRKRRSAESDTAWVCYVVGVK